MLQQNEIQKCSEPYCIVCAVDGESCLTETEQPQSVPRKARAPAPIRYRLVDKTTSSCRILSRVGPRGGILHRVCAVCYDRMPRGKYQRGQCRGCGIYMCYMCNSTYSGKFRVIKHVYYTYPSGHVQKYSNTESLCGECYGERQEAHHVVAANPPIEYEAK